MKSRKITGSIRVSSEEQKKYGQQVNVYRDDLKRHGVKEEDIFVELARSGSLDEDKDMIFAVKDGKFIIEFDLRKKRPGLYNWLVNEVMKGNIEKHYITKWDRWARNVFIGEGLVYLCRKYGTEIVATQDGNENQQRFFSLFWAHVESMFTKKRVDDNKQYKFDKGLYLGTENKYGYQKSKIKIDSREFLHLVPKKNEIDMIRDIFLKPKSEYKSICEKYRISPQIYYAIRKDKFYCGYIRYNDVEKKGIHEPIVSEDEWKRSQN